MKETIAYKATGNSKKYHSINLNYDGGLSICMWAIDKKTGKNVANIKRDQLCKKCFCNYLKKKKIIKTGKVNNRFELLDL